MKLSFLITLFAVVTSIESRGQVNNGKDLNSVKKVTRRSTLTTPDPKRVERLKSLQKESRSMTNEDLYERGYPETGLVFNSTTDESIYFSTKYKSLSEAKCYQYRNQLLRHKFLKEDQEGPGFEIVGGEEASIIDHPYVGGLGYELTRGKLNFICGCTLISHHFALTAAHCASKKNKRPSIVRFGTDNIHEHGTDYNIYHVKQYPTYRHYSSKPEDYDIALVQTKSRIEFNKFVQPACLWRSEDTTSLTHVSVSGWGTTNPNGKQMSFELQNAYLEIVNNTECKVRYKNNGARYKRISSNQICASKLGVDSCQGDSGGPLEAYSNRIQFVIGVTSHGHGCAESNVPGIYIRVARFVSWIQRTVWKNWD
ncbi:PREDICTED: trypsin-7-like isoform X2 [Papilio polytes]|uniref:trypsin-7-like isoform X2 n=1 Tax=Papilio polytes TaxID=76194 RepID=UPI000676864C|nr:PREDICTED: trypsin-7-like isoform X2 [Papilio polytes]